MPELSRFYGLVIKMLYQDDSQHRSIDIALEALYRKGFAYEHVA